MKTWLRRAALLVVCALVLGIAADLRAGTIAPDLEKALEAGGGWPGEEFSVIVTLSGRVDPAALQGRPRSELLRALKDKAKSTQAPLHALLRQRGARRLIELWAINGIAVTTDAAVIRELAGLPEVESIRLDATVSAPETVAAAAAAPEWNLSAVRAPELWAQGYSGSGIVVASMDTGVDSQHPDLAGRWRGGTNSWFDPNGEHAYPYDRSGHGTRVMGLLVGGEAGGTAIGIAPGASWICAKIFNDAGTATLSGIHQGFQWLLDPDGNTATDDAPHVVNNSWGFPGLTNQCFPEFETDIQTLRAAGTAVVFSAGNEGPWQHTSVSPADNPSGYGVGAVDAGDLIGDFSSRGPSACDGTAFPEVTAPGVSVRTAELTLGGMFPDSYVTVSGTSFAAPHVAGGMALLLSARPAATVAALEAALKASARDLGSVGADDTYGHGRIDLVQALAALSSQPACRDADGDGFFAGAGCGPAADCDDGDASVFPGAPEIKHDGIDQDCNGYDLTIDILRAQYSAKKKTLSVEATSSLGSGAALALAGYGPLKWTARSASWKGTVQSAVDPGSVTVSGIEGTASAATVTTR